jgi:hypothetical protein
MGDGAAPSIGDRAAGVAEPTNKRQIVTDGTHTFDDVLRCHTTEVREIASKRPRHVKLRSAGELGSPDLMHLLRAASRHFPNLGSTGPRRE